MRFTFIMYMIPLCQAVLMMKCKMGTFWSCCDTHNAPIIWILWSLEPIS